MHQLNNAWFGERVPLLEYNIKEDVAFCLCFYLFKTDEISHFGGDAFTIKGFRVGIRWVDSKTTFGGVSTVHNQCAKWCEDLMMQRQSNTNCIG